MSSRSRSTAASACCATRLSPRHEGDPAAPPRRPGGARICRGADPGSRRGQPKALRRLLFPEAEDIDALFPDARSEPREIAVGRDEAKPIETATMQKVHSVDHQCDVGRILA